MYKMKAGNFWIFIAILVLGVVLRIWELPKYPIHLNHDEITQLYDAISVAQTGRDIYGNFLPVIFPSVGDFKPPFYTYATSLVYILSGDHEWIVRVTGAIFGILIIPMVFLFTTKLTSEPKIALWATFFTAISPAEIFFSRKSFENGAGIFFLLTAAICLLMYLQKQERLRWLYLAILFSSLGMYTYFSHAIIIPLMLGAFILIFRKKFTQRFTKYLPVFLLWVVLIIPLIFIFTNPDSRYRSQTVFITQDVMLGGQLNLLTYANQYVSQFLHFKMIGDFSFNRYLKQFDPMFLFGNGLDLTNQGPINIGPLLFLQLPLLFMAIFYIAQRVDFKNIGKLFAFWIALGMLPSGLTFEPHSPHRMVIVFTILNIVSGIGAFSLWQKMNRLKTAVKTVLAFIFVMALTTNLGYFLHIYFVNYPYEKSQSIHYPFKEVATFAWSMHDSVDQIVFDPLFGEIAPVMGTAAHYYLAYYGNVPPAKFQREYRQGVKEREELFDKFSIRKIDWRDDQKLTNTLFIGSLWSLPIDSISQDKIVKTFYFYNNQPAFYAVKL